MQPCPYCFGSGYIADGEPCPHPCHDEGLIGPGLLKKMQDLADESGDTQLGTKLYAARIRRQNFAPDEVAALEGGNHERIEQAVVALKAKQKAIRLEVTVDMITAGAKVVMEFAKMNAVEACQLATGVYLVMERKREK